MIRRSVECWVVGPDRRVLLLLVPGRPGRHEAFWQPVTGGIEPGKSPVQAAVRKVAEETGLRLTEDDLTEVARGVVIEISTDLRIDKVLYAARAHDDRVIRSDEHVNHRWVAAGEVAGALHWGGNRRTWELVRRAVGLADGPDRPDGHPPARSGCP